MFTSKDAQEHIDYFFKFVRAPRVGIPSWRGLPVNAEDFLDLIGSLQHARDALQKWEERSKRDTNQRFREAEERWRSENPGKRLYDERSTR